MSGVVLIISIPTEDHEKCLLKKFKKRVVIDETPDVMSPRTKSDTFSDFEKDFGNIGSQEFKFSGQKEYQSMEKIIKSTIKELEIADITWRKTEDNNHYQIIFPIECGGKCEEVLDILKENEIGNKLNSKISVMPCTIHYHGNEVNENVEMSEEEHFINDKKSSGWNLFVSSVKSRLTVAQVVENVKAKAAMTFDFLMLLLISTTLCALGLVENNNIYMLSSMLISPMMCRQTPRSGSMSGVVLIISIPTEDHEKCLLKKFKKRVVIDETPDVMSPRTKSDTFSDFEKDFGNIGSQEFKFSGQKEYQSMEKIIKSTIKELEIADITWRKTEDNNHYQIIFPIECGGKCEEVLDILKENEIGNKLNSKISVMPCTIHYHGNEVNENVEMSEEEHFINDKKSSGWNLFVSSVKSRLTVAQVVENVKAKAAMTFDFLMLLLISTTLCALGLVENNNIYMLSSMLISPMMGPVMAATFGSIIQDRQLQKTGVKNELIGLGIATLVGFCYGSIICITTDRYGNSDWPTYEMYSRGELRSLWVGAIIALLSGAAVALGILSDNIASLVGVAISTSLMPPAVNAGLIWSLGFVYYIKNDETTRYASLTHTDYFSKNSAVELSALGAISICLTFVNIVCIYAAAILVFMIKEVAPHTTRDNVRGKFWKHDIKIARNYNKTIQFEESNNAYQSILDQIAANQKIKDLNHFSMDLSKGNFKVDIKRPQYTWSPCLNDVYRQCNEFCSNNKTAREKRNQHRRLSQIFPKPILRMDENLETVPEKVNEKTPLLKAAVAYESTGSTYLLSSGKKIVVTPCDLNNGAFQP